MARLQDKVAFITGAGSGIARAAERLFAQEGARVVIAELKPELGRISEQAVRDLGGDAAFIETDVTKEESVKNSIQQTIKQFGKLDILYNCAGGSIVQDAPVTEVDMFVWQHTISLDLLGTFHCCRHVVPTMIAQGNGSIVNTSSWGALQGFSKHVYATAKGGILSLTKALAKDYSQHNIRANAICPGVIKTERIMARYGANAINDPGSIARSLGGDDYPFFTGDPIDIAYIGLFLASDESRMITGATIPADGGRSAY